MLGYAITQAECLNQWTEPSNTVVFTLLSEESVGPPQPTS